MTDKAKEIEKIHLRIQKQRRLKKKKHPFEFPVDNRYWSYTDSQSHTITCADLTLQCNFCKQGIVSVYESAVLH